jgi:hypothetical protein
MSRKKIPEKRGLPGNESAKDGINGEKEKKK